MSQPPTVQITVPSSTAAASTTASAKPPPTAIIQTGNTQNSSSNTGHKIATFFVLAVVVTAVVIGGGVIIYFIHKEYESYKATQKTKSSSTGSSKSNSDSSGSSSSSSGSSSSSSSGSSSSSSYIPIQPTIPSSLPQPKSYIPKQYVPEGFPTTVSQLPAVSGASSWLVNYTPKLYLFSDNVMQGPAADYSCQPVTVANSVAWILAFKTQAIQQSFAYGVQVYGNTSNTGSCTPSSISTNSLAYTFNYPSSVGLVVSYQQMVPPPGGVGGCELNNQCLLSLLLSTNNQRIHNPIPIGTGNPQTQFLYVYVYSTTCAQVMWVDVATLQIAYTYTFNFANNSGGACSS